LRPSLRHPSDEAVLFGRLAVFGLVVGFVYWFLTYESAGTVMLLGFGVASGIASIALWAQPSRSAIEGDGEAGGPDVERIPAPALAPLIVAAGLAVTALGVALGALILPVGVIVALIGARYWLEAAVREADARDAGM
jgi:hypothetical protein